MKVEYRIAENDYADAMRFHQWRRVFRWPSAIVPLLLILTAWWLNVVALAVVLALLAAVAGYIGVDNGARRMYRQYKAIQEPMTVELADEGLRLGSAHGEGILPWRMIFQWRQNNQFVLIYTMPSLFYMVPKSVVQRGFDIPLLVQRLAERVGPER
jgi:hypothetical protein